MALRSLLWAACYVAAAFLGRATRPAGSPLALVWPAAGVAVLWILSTTPGRRRWSAAALLVLSGAVNLATGADPLVAASLGLANVVHAVVVVHVLEHRGRTGGGGGPTRLASTQDLLHLTAASFAGAVVSVPLGAPVFLVSHGTGIAAAVGAWVVRYGVISVMVVAVALTWPRRAGEPSDGDARRGVPELALTTAATAVLYGFVFFGRPGEATAFLVLPMTIWVAVRNGPFVTSVHGFASAAVAVLATHLGDGPFGPIEDRLTQSVTTQAFIAVVGVVGLALSLAMEERRRALRQASRAGETLQRTLDSALIGHAVITLGADAGRILLANPALRDWSGQGDDLPGSSWYDLVAPEDRTMAATVLDGLAGGQQQWSGELRHRTGRGVRWCEVSLAKLPRDPESHDGERQASLQLLDTTTRRRLAERLSHQALHDELTGLPNRLLLRERLDHALAAERRSGRTVALVFLDLDHFKTVNDSLGHAVGDAVITEVARRLASVIRPGDTLARIGGDEFVVCCPGIEHRGQAADIATRLLAAVAEPFGVEGRHLSIGMSAGIALAGENADAGNLLRESDTAMYAAKTRGRGRIEFFEEDLFRQAQRRLRLGVEVRDALTRNEFLLHYQPIISLESGGIVAVEALLRWRHPHRGLLLPGEWLDVVEQQGQVMPRLGAWVIGEATRELAELPESSGVRVHVNVTATQLRHGIVDTVLDAVDANGLAPSKLVLELTESELLVVHDDLLHGLEELRERGVVLCVDDFGTHYASLTQLTTLPIEEVKIDRSFVVAMEDDVKARAIVQGVLGMARAMGLGVVAEGVETTRAAEDLRAWGCTWGQGYLWSRPQPWSEVKPLLLAQAAG